MNEKKIIVAVLNTKSSGPKGINFKNVPTKATNKRKIK